MTSFFAFLSENAQGFAVLVGILFFLILSIQWTAWLFKWGRFRKIDATADRPSIRYMVVEFMIEIINDFRNLLAVALTLIFAVAILSVLFITWNNESDIDVFKDGLQVVIGSMGGLIGSVIGYYFGESAAKNKAESSTKLAGREEKQKGDADDIEKVDDPPPVKEKQKGDADDLEKVDNRSPDSDVHESPERDENESGNRN